MNEMNKDIDAIFDLLDKLMSNNEMKYSAYSALHDQISFLADSLKEQHEIVKCKDCKHAVLTSRDTQVKYCKLWQGDEDGSYGGDPLYLDSEFFCAGAERREVE